MERRFRPGGQVFVYSDCRQTRACNTEFGVRPSVFGFRKHKSSTFILDGTISPSCSSSNPENLDADNFRLSEFGVRPKKVEACPPKPMP